ncbi:cytochrome P450 [Hypomontagnella monticulosa]|nr:cytochrome P450 [Hypomontagnella monticulosa]
MATYEYPSFMAKAATVPRERLVKALIAYIDAPRENRSGAVAYVNEVEDEMRQAGLGNEACARILMIILWGINSNVQMTAFWIMCHILPNAELIAEIRTEIALVMTAVDEILCVFGGKTIPKGSKILLPQHQLLLAPEAFGHDAHVVNLYRFIQNKSIERHEYYRPFGRGITHCSGKTIGRYEVLAFVAWALWKYEIKVVPEARTVVDEGKDPAIPRIDLKKPSLGISKQVEGDDMVLQISKRAAVFTRS